MQEIEQIDSFPERFRELKQKPTGSSQTCDESE
jgi:hypothetical protein